MNTRITIDLDEDHQILQAKSEQLGGTSEPAGERVDGPGQMMEALNDAKGGETFVLSARHYGEMRIADKHFDDPVTFIASEKHQSIFGKLTVGRCSGLEFDQLGLDYVFKDGDPDHVFPFFCGQSERIAYTRCLFDGDAGEGMSRAAINGHSIGTGFYCRDSKNIHLGNSEIRAFRLGCVIFAGEECEIVSNDFHSLRSDAIDFISMASLDIVGNHIHDYAKAENSGDHQDGVQGWTDANQPASSDIRIANNFINSGAGGYTQSIFVRNEMVDRGISTFAEKAYKGIIIEDNLIHNGHTWGIMVGETDGLIIRRNTVMQNAHDRVSDELLWVPGIRPAAASLNVRIDDNISSRDLMVPKTIPPTWHLENNAVITPGDQQARLFVKGNAGATAIIADLMPKPGTFADKNNIGSRIKHAGPVAF